MNDLSLAVGIAALAIGTVGLVVGCLSLAFVVGVKNSTHQVVWKEADSKSLAEEAEEVDEFTIPAIDPEENPNKKKKLDPKDEEFADLSDPSVTSNNW